MEDFKKVIEDMALVRIVDGGSSLVHERLDRFFASCGWLQEVSLLYIRVIR